MATIEKVTLEIEATFHITKGDEISYAEQIVELNSNLTAYCEDVRIKTIKRD